jgi:hypothetical protein
MTTATYPLDDSSFISQFENQTLDPVHFSHTGHIRIAWLYLNAFEFENARQKVCSGIKRYAESLGATDKFNLTLTDALVKIIARRMEPMSAPTWPSFLQENQDLFDNALGILGEYFSPDILFSEAAKIRLLPPDVRPL